MTWRCEECGSDEIVEEVRQNINTDEIVDSVDDSTTCNDCGSRNLFEEEEE
jgi:DNA-directed RNA polymerase subunit RPC12/RpoP